VRLLNPTSGGGQNRQPPPHNPNFGSCPSAFDRIGPSSPTPRPFGGIGSDESQITQELRHRMQSMELEVRHKEGECGTSNYHSKSTVVWTDSSQTTFPISVSLSPRRNQRPHTPQRRRRHHNNSDDK
ncbi:hypothetical protein PIB30_074018, partial [Stylosanthes scabra]|nr:hypothetical protein [Stylosanthes scabra]